MDNSPMVEELRLPAMISYTIVLFLSLVFFAVFGRMGSFASLVISTGVFLTVSMLLTRQRFVREEENETQRFAGSVMLICAGALSVFVFITAPIWDEARYCAKQTSAELVNIGPKSLQDVFKGVERNDVYISSEEKRCLEYGAWSHSVGTVEKITAWISGLVGIFGVGGLAWLSYSENRKLQEFERSFSNKTAFIRSTVPVEPWNARSILEASSAEMIEMMKMILADLKTAPRKSTRELLGKFEHWTPEMHRFNTDEVPSDANLAEILEMYTFVIGFIPSTFTDKEIEKGTLDRRIKKLSARVKAIDEELQSRKGKAESPL